MRKIMGVMWNYIRRPLLVLCGTFILWLERRQIVSAGIEVQLENLHSSSPKSESRVRGTFSNQQQKVLKNVFQLLSKYPKSRIQCSSRYSGYSVIYIMLIPEKLEMVGPCWLLKLSQMGTQRVQMKGVFPLVGLLGSSCRYKRLLSCLGCPGLFPHRTLYQLICPHRPATWAGTRAGPPFYEYVSPAAHTVLWGCGMAKWLACQRRLKVTRTYVAPVANSLLRAPWLRRKSPKVWHWQLPVL
jgi:hypothetical protein